MLIAYYSLGGNTDRIAKMIRETTGAQIARIETCRAYAGSYNDIVDRGQWEIDDGYLPEIKQIDADPSDHETLILGSPVWWYALAPAMRAFLKDRNLQGKDIYPFVTNGGWPGQAFEDCKDRCPGATVHHGLDVRFSESTLLTTETAIEDWAGRIAE